MNLLDNVLKWLVQTMVMISDIIIICMTLLIIICAYQTGSLILWLIVIFLLYNCYISWKDQGGFISWTSKGRQSFFNGWNDITKKNKTE